MIISFFFIILSAAVVIDCNEDKGLTNDVKKSSGDFLNDRANILQALVRMESRMKDQSQQQQSLQNSVADLRKTVAERRIKVTEDVSALSSKLNKVENKRSVDQQGRVQVAFTAHFSHDDIYNGVKLGYHSILRMNRSETNIGGGYNPNTGIFTAPLNGVYVFFVSIMGTIKKGLVSVAIEEEKRVNIFELKKVLDIIYVWGGATHQASGLVTTKLAAGDQVYVRQERGCAVRGDWWSVFSGYRL